MLSPTGEASKIFRPNAEEVWALVIMRAAKSAVKVGRVVMVVKGPFS